MTKKIVAVLFSSLILLISISASGDELREGFLGIPWQSEISELTGFTKVSKRGLVDYYRNPERIYTLNEIHIPDVVYGFYENRFFAVYINIDSPDTFGKIKHHMISKYGDPRDSYTVKNKIRVYSWDHHTVKIKLKLNENVGNMKLGFYYLPISQKVNLDQEEAFMEKTPRFFPIEKDKKPEYIPIFRF